MKDSRVGMMQNSMDAFELNVVRKRTICDLDELKLFAVAWVDNVGAEVN